MASPGNQRSTDLSIGCIRNSMVPRRRCSLPLSRSAQLPNDLRLGQEDSALHSIRFFNQYMESKLPDPRIRHDGRLQIVEVVRLVQKVESNAKNQCDHILSWVVSITLKSLLKRTDAIWARCSPRCSSINPQPANASNSHMNCLNSISNIFLDELPRFSKHDSAY